MSWLHNALISAFTLLISVSTLMVSKVSLAEGPIKIANLKRSKPVDFQTEILPLLKKNCLACHNAKKAESELVLETPHTILKGGSEGTAVVPGKSLKSLILLSAAHQGDSEMPPEDNKVGAVPFTSQELGLLKLWIDQGATGNVTMKLGPVKWKKLPKTVQPINAVAISPNGLYTACGRGNQILIYQTFSGRMMTRLSDPALSKTKIYTKSNVAHFDLVQTLAFSPNGQWLASGGYRTVKLWKRPQNVRLSNYPNLSESAHALAINSLASVAAIGEKSGKIQLLDLKSGKVIRTLSGHTAAINAVTFIENKNELLSVSDDKTIRLWNTNDGSALKTINTPAKITSVVIVNQNKQIATGHDDKLIRIWDLPNAEMKKQATKPIRELKGHIATITALASGNQEASQLISASSDKSIIQWNLSNGQILRKMNHGSPISDLAVNHQQKRLASASDNGTVKLWNVTDGKQIAEMKGNFQLSYLSAKAQRDLNLANRILSDQKKAIQQAEATVKKETESLTKATAGQPVAKKLTVEKNTAKEKQVAVLKQYEMTLVKLKADIQKIKTQLVELQKSVATAKTVTNQAKTALAAAKPEAKKAAAEKEKLAQANLKQLEVQVRKLPQQQKQLENQLNSKTQNLKKVRDATNKAVAEYDNAVAAEKAAQTAFDASTAAVKNATEKVARLKQEQTEIEKSIQLTQTELKAATAKSNQSQKPIRSLAFSLDGKVLYSAGDDGIIHSWETKNGKPSTIFSGHQSPILAIDVTASGQLLSLAANKTVIQWDANPPWQLVKTIGNFDDPTQIVDRVTALDFSSDGKVIASGSGETSRSGEIKLWDVETGKLILAIKDPHSDTVYGLKFSPDAKHIASSSADRFVKVFTVANGKRIRSFEGHSHHVLGVSWSADGKILASCGADKVVKIWDFASGNQRKSITGYNNQINAIQFVGTEQKILVTSGDRQLKLHRIDGRVERSYSGNTSYMNALSISNDGNWIVAGGQDGVLRVWQKDNNTPTQVMITP